jgi:hypothetical protein
MRRALVLIVLAPLAVGCGAKPSDNLDGTAAAFSDAASSRVEIRVTSGEKTIFVAAGAFDYERDVGELKVRAAEEIGEPAPDIFRLIGRMVYTGWTIGGKRRWQKEEDFEPTDAEELVIPFEGGPPPDRVITLLLKTSTRTQILGNDEIRGVNTRHHLLHVDEDALLREFGIENALDDHAKSTLVIHAWVDEDNLVRRLLFPESNEDSGNEQATMDFFDFGVKVDVEAPPKDQVLSDNAFYKLLEQDCKAQGGNDASKGDFCAMMGTGEGSGGTPAETTPRTEEPSK